MREVQEIPVYRIIGENIKFQRQKNKIKQSDLSSRLGLSRTSLVNIEQGKQFASLILLYNMCNALGCNLHDLIPDSNEIKKQIDSNKANRIPDTELGDKSKKGVQEFMEKFNF